MHTQQAQPTTQKSAAGTIACCIIGAIGGAALLVIVTAATMVYIGLKRVPPVPPPTTVTPMPVPPAEPMPAEPAQPAAPSAAIEADPSITEAEDLVLKFLVAIEQADAATARSCTVPGSEPFDLDLLGQGDYDHKGFDRVDHTQVSPSHLVFTAREIMEDWETGDYFYEDWGIVVKHDGARWQITEFGAG